MMVTIQRKIAWALVFCFSSFISAIAQPSLTTTVDNTSILIGEQVKIKVVATMPKQDFFVKWLEIPDTLHHFEIVDKSKIDSSFTNQKLTGLSQTITLTSFDSGKWAVPAFDVDFNPVDGGQSVNLYTDSFLVNVYYQPDSTAQLKDIKTIRDAKEDKPFWYWIALVAGVLVLIGLIVWLYFFFKKRKKMAPAKPAISPYQMALKKMEELKHLNLQDAASIKKYHAGLTEILKEYLASTQGPHFISSTTAEVLRLLNQKNFSKEMLANTEEAIRRSDAAKFAKFLPSNEESAQSWQSIKLAIDFIEQLQNKTEQSAG